MKTKKGEIESRRVVILKHGQRMCINPHCRRVFTPTKFDQEHCTQTCQHDAPSRRGGRIISATPNGRIRVKLIAIVAVIMFLLSSCGHMTEKQIHRSMEQFQLAIDSLHSEQRAIAHEQQLLFLNYRELYKRMTTIDTTGIHELSAVDSIDLKMRLLMIEISLDNITINMREMSKIYNEIWREINNIYVAIDELERYCGRFNKFNNSKNGKQK